MKILTYKNRFQAIFDLVFKPSIFKQRIKSEISDAETKLRHEYEDKVSFLFRDRKVNGRTMIHPQGINRMPLVDMPLHDMADLGIIRPAHQDTNKDILETCTLNAGFFNRFTTIDAIKSIAANRLANELISRGFLLAEAKGNDIVFYITYAI